MAWPVQMAEPRPVLGQGAGRGGALPHLDKVRRDSERKGDTRAFRAVCVQVATGPGSARQAASPGSPWTLAGLSPPDSGSQKLGNDPRRGGAGGPNMV